MAPQLEPLNLKITGSATGLYAALGQSEKSLRTWFKGIGGIGLGGFTIGATAAAAFGTAAAAATITLRGVRHELEEIDTIAKSADRIGASFKDIVGLRLGISESTGLNDSAIDAGLQKFILNLQEAKETGKGVSATLARLGLEAGQLIQAGPVSAIAQLSIKLREIKDPADKLTIAFELFGKKGAAFVTALKGGPEALRESARWADKVGLTLTKQQTDMVEASNDAWGRVQLTATAFFRQLAAESAPVLLDIANQVEGISDSFGGPRKASEHLTARMFGLNAITKDLVHSYEALIALGERPFFSATFPKKEIEAIFDTSRSEATFLGAMFREPFRQAAKGFEEDLVKTERDLIKRLQVDANRLRQELAKSREVLQFPTSIQRGSSADIQARFLRQHQILTGARAEEQIVHELEQVNDKLADLLTASRNVKPDQEVDL